MNREAIRFALAVCVVLLGAASFMLLLWFPVPEANQRIVDIALGIILGWGSLALAFYFGTSQSSADKNDVIRDMHKRGTVTVDQPADKPIPVEEKQP